MSIVIVSITCPSKGNANDMRFTYKDQMDQGFCTCGCVTMLLHAITYSQSTKKEEESTLLLNASMIHTQKKNLKDICTIKLLYSTQRPEIKYMETCINFRRINFRRISHRADQFSLGSVFGGLVFANQSSPDQLLWVNHRGTLLYKSAVNENACLY